jgi:hypothetical protein
MHALTTAISVTSLPLCVRLAYDRSKRWRSYHETPVSNAAATRVCVSVVRALTRVGPPT